VSLKGINKIRNLLFGLSVHSLVFLVIFIVEFLQDLQANVKIMGWGN